MRCNRAHLVATAVVVHEGDVVVLSVAIFLFGVETKTLLFL
jgi:hypothetical protein